MKRLLSAAALALLGFQFLSPAWAKAPPRYVALAGEVVNVVDGDTLDVAVAVDWKLPTTTGGQVAVHKLIVRVRLLSTHGGCWAPETHRQASIADAGERQREFERGLASKRHLETLALDKPCTILVAWTSNRAIDYLSLERLLAQVRVRGVGLVGDLQIETKHASTVKGGILGE